MLVNRHTFLTIAFALTLILGGFASVSAYAEEFLCYAISDADNTLRTIHRVNGTPQSNIGGTGVGNLESAQFSLDSTILYSANANTFGTVNISTGAYSSIGAFGSGTGVDGNVDFLDIDGLAIDPISGIMYASVRRVDGAPNDVLIQVNVGTGSHINNAFGTGNDYIVIDTNASTPGIYDIDDIAINPVDGQMYGVANTSGGNDRLVKINKSTGAVTDVARLTYSGGNLNDMEGFSFYSDGTFYGTTGQAGAAATNNRLWEIDLLTGFATEIDEFAGGGDYEGVACLLDGPTVDLQIVKTAAPATVQTNDTLTYTLVVTNNGPVTAPDVVVSDTLPAEVTWVSTTPSQGSCSDPDGVICELGSILNGNSATVTIVVTVN